MLVPLSSRFRTLFDFQNVHLMMPLSTLMGECSLPLGLPSPNRNSRVLPSILARETICTFSQVRRGSVAEKLGQFLSHDNSVAGIGLGAILGRVKSVTDEMVEAASLGLADSLTDEERALGLLYPRVERSRTLLAIPLKSTRWLNVSVVRDISAHIARAVIQAAQREVSSNFQYNRQILRLNIKYRGWIVMSLCEAWATLTFLKWSKRRCGRLCEITNIYWKTYVTFVKQKTWVPVNFRLLFLLLSQCCFDYVTLFDNTFNDYNILLFIPTGRTS